jgi:DNA-binding transcriptional regulator LsrR (DeoR family)|tara:strand:- start:1003 stop:1257 length:255 start_codon:yes stop_codon:yes gene_type:complete
MNMLENLDFPEGTNITTLFTCGELTEAMERLQKQISDCGKLRRAIWYHLWKDNKMTQQQLADESGVSRQIVYLEIKRYKQENNL